VRRRWLISLLFFASGASGLVYEVVWVRLFGSLFGSTVYSAALVTGIFVCGLGLGGRLAGRWADARLAADPRAPLRSYGLFELGIAALAAAVGLWLLPWLGELVVAVAAYAPGANGWLGLAPTTSLLRYVAAAALLLPVTVLMGGTLTLLIRDRLRDDLSAAGWDVSVLYGVNTAGAALGCLLTDTVLVPELGIRGTQLLAVSANVCAGLGALVLARSAGGAATPGAPPPARPVPPPRQPGLRALAAALALAGFAAMAFQIVWFRYLIAFYGGYRPVFSILLTVILIGIGLGAWLGGALASRVGRPALLLALALAGFALATLAGLAAAEGSREAFARAYAGPPPWAFYALYFRGVAAVALLPAVLSGAVFPLANALAQREPSAVGAHAGLLYLANTVGGVLGSLLGGFALLPALGVQATASVAAASVLLALAALFLASGALERASRRAALAAGAATALGLLAWQSLPPEHVVERTLWVSQAEGDRLLSFDEGVSETIAILERPGPVLSLVTNGHTMSGTGVSAQRYMRAFVHVPLLIGDRIERVMLMCFGVGNTASAMLLHPGIQSIDVVDVSREILGQAHYFAPSNGLALRDPRVRVFANDARLHLRMQPEGSYDLITGEPPPITEAGIVNLYSVEFFELARTRLRERGFVTYWLPIYQIGEGVARAVVRAFHEAFPGAVVLSGHGAELLLVGRKGGPIVLPLDLQQRIDADPRLRRELRWIALDRVADWAALLAGSAASIGVATQHAAPVSDDRPLLEYGAAAWRSDRRLPADLFSLDDVAAWCPVCRSPALSAPERDEIAGALEVTRAYYRSRAFLEPASGERFAPRLSTRGWAALRRSRYLRELAGDLPPGQFQAASLRQHGFGAQAIALLQQLVETRPDDALVRLDLAELLAEAGRPEEARAQLAEAQRLDPLDGRAQRLAADIR
jgi:spermidine synthase